MLFIGTFLSKTRGTKGVIETIADSLAKQNFVLKLISRHENIYLRIIDIALAILFTKEMKIHIDVFSGSAFRIAALATYIAKARNKFIILNLHGGRLPECYALNPKRYDKVFKRANTILSPSTYLIKYFNSKGYQIEHLPNSIHPELFPYTWKARNEKTLLWVRGFTDIYKPECAIRVVHQLKAIYPNIKLTMIGPDLGKLGFCLKLISSLGLAENIQITGAISNNELNKYYASHAIYINTTSYESFGVALVEAACSGIPIVSTDVGEIPLMWKNREEMMIVKDKDENEFVHQIKLLFEDKDLQMKLSRNARLKAEQFSWEKVKHQWENYLS